MVTVGLKTPGPDSQLSLPLLTPGAATLTTMAAVGEATVVAAASVAVGHAHLAVVAVGPGGLAERTQGTRQDCSWCPETPLSSFVWNCNDLIPASGGEERS